MSITSSAKKALRSSKRKRIFNLGRRENIKTAVKAFKLKPTAEGLAAAYKALDKAAKRGVIKKGNAARRKSRLAALLVS